MLQYLCMNINNQDNYFIAKAIAVSKKSISIGGYPVGAVIVRDGKIVAQGLSNGKNNLDATMHAEIDAIRKASKKLHRRNLDDIVLYSSLEPCEMCFFASFWAYIPRIVYACERKRVKKIYYMGDHNLAVFNKKNRRKIDLVHLKQFSNSAFKIIDDWEKSLHKSKK